MDKPKYKIGTKLYWCNYVHLVRKEEYKKDSEWETEAVWRVEGGEITVSEIIEIRQSKDFDGNTVFHYIIKPNGNYEESRLLKVFSLTKEEAKESWKEPHRDTIKRQVDEKIEWIENSIKSTKISGEEEIQQLKQVITEMSC